MLEFERTKEGYVKVTEKLITWNKTEIKTVLYDMENKRSKVNNDPWYNMTESSINWVNKYYVPKLKES